MRPRRLTISAFGPFAGSEEIDFDALAGHGVFLIAGETGAGKTTIFDALGFALYGSMPGARGEGELRARSDHADASTKTSVTLEFEAKGSEWRVTRSPKVERVKARGTGTTIDQATAILEQRAGDAWEGVETRKKDVDDRVAALVGLDAAQFQQVVLLPQGRFEQVLRASTEDRRKLLRTLFGTAHFLDAVDRLKKEATARARARDDALQRIEFDAGQAFDKWAALSELTSAHLDPDPLSPPPDRPEEGRGVASLVAAASRALTDGAATACAQLVAAAETAERLRDDAARKKASAEAIIEQWDKRKDMRERRQRLDETETEARAAEGRLEQADRASRVTRLVAAAANAKLDYDEALAALREVVESARQALRAAPAGPYADPADLDAATSAQLATDLKVVEQVRRTAVDDLKRADSLDEQATNNDSEADGHGATLERLDAADLDVEPKTRALDEARQAARDAEGRLGERRKAAEAARHTLEAASELRAIDAARIDLRAEAKRAAGLAEECSRALIAARKAFDAGAAARLAEALRDGESCPVCGSPDHPRPAPPANDIPTEDDLLLAEAADGQAQRSATDAHGRAEGLESKYSTLEARLRELELPVDDLDRLDEACDTAVAEAERSLATDEQLAQGLAEIDAQLRQIAAHARERTTKRKEAQEQHSRAIADAAAARDQAKSLRSRVTSELGEGVDPAAEAAAASAAAEAVGRLAATLRVRDSREAAFVQANEAADRALSETGFADAEAARAASLSDSELADLRRRVDERKMEESEVKGALDLLEAAELPEERPDIEALDDAARGARAKAAGARDAATRANGHADDLGGFLTKVETGRGELAELERRASVARNLAEVCDGQTHDRVSLEAWVLATYLREVTRVATRHLHEMSGGRYRLEVREERGPDARKRQGLDLVVHDAFTGLQRPVWSLSGGETFQASLALALGLADVVQSRAGGVRLEALFVDEGFGSLDAGALDLAVSQLYRLQGRGRIVGVISHVEGLRDRLPCGIQVEKRANGSRAVQHLPGSFSPQ